MTEHNPEHNPEHTAAQAAMAADRAAIQAEAAEHERRHQVVWEQQVADAETTLEQRRALTRRVRAQASLMETLDTLVWVVLIVGTIIGGWYGVGQIVSLFR